MNGITNTQADIENEVYWKQSEILGEILDLYSEVKELQESINIFIEENRKLPEKYRDKDMDESIESYFTYDL